MSITSEKLFDFFYKIQEAEISPPLVTWDNVLDAEENWILKNCPDLYTIEKVSDQLQKKVRDININRQIINGILTTYNNIAPPSIPRILETGHNAKRIVFSEVDFVHDGQVPSGPRMGLGVEGYKRNINELKRKISEALVDMWQNNQILYSKSFVILLSLNFGRGEGGHFGAVLGTLDQPNRTIELAIVDPYAIYAPAFEYLVNDAFRGLQQGYNVYNSATRQFNNTNSPVSGYTSPFAGYILTPWNRIVTNYLESISYQNSGIAPTTQTEEYAVQSYWGQDHFCFMWCILFIHKFLIDGRFVSVGSLYNEINSNANINLVIIKAYTIKLLQAINLPMTAFFKDLFKYVWSCYTTKIGGSLPPADQVTYVPPIPLPVFQVYEIQYDPSNNFLFDLTIANLGINLISPVNLLPNITTFQGLPCSNDINDKRAIIVNNPNLGLVETNSVFRLINIITNAYRAFKDPDELYRDFTSNTGDIIFPLCPSQLASDTATYMNLAPAMEKIPGKFCQKLEGAINKRNLEYDIQNQNIVCPPYAIGAVPTPILFDYQQKAVDTMISKSSVTPAPPGLLVWFGTGTGKTITANTVAKITTLCQQRYRRCFIISTKSVYTSFAASLGRDTGLTPDALLPNPSDPNQKQSAAYFDRHTESNTIPNLTNYIKPATDIYVFSSTRFNGIMSNPETGLLDPRYIPILSESLLIIDEAHKVINIDGRIDGEYAFFNSCCRVAQQVMLMTATPIVNTPYDIEMLLALVDRRLPDNKTDFKLNYSGTLTTHADLTDICPARGISDVNFSLNPTYDRTPNNANNTVAIRTKFGDRIIYAMPVGNLPVSRERKLCITSPDFSLLEALAARPSQEMENMSTSVAKSFGSREINTPAYSTTKISTIIQIIKTRENTPSSDLINERDLLRGVYMPPASIKFKYVIYSQSTRFLEKLRRDLITGLGLGMNPNIIDSITGNTTDRQGVTKRYNIGDVRILLITDAAMEGVDLRRTAMVLLAEPVWTKAKYDQIKGRGIRTLSGLRLKPADRAIVDKRIDEKRAELEAEYIDRLREENDTLNKEMAKLSSGRGSTRIAAANTLKIQQRITNLYALKHVSDQNRIEAITALDRFQQDNINPAGVLINSISQHTPYSVILKEELDFSDVPATIDCMTIVLSYNIPIGMGRIKYSIDTYKYNAMRVKNSENNFFTQNMLESNFIPYP
jgi:superfamily II DNA or RNA helicase